MKPSWFTSLSIAGVLAFSAASCAGEERATTPSGPEGSSGQVGASGAPGNRAGANGLGAGGSVPSGGAGVMSSGGSNPGGTAPAGGAPGSGGSAAGGAPSSDILAPVGGALLGHFYGDASIDATTAKLGRTPPVHLTYYAWDDDWTGDRTKADLDLGRIPFVNWEPFTVTLDDIVAGAYDAMLQERAEGAKNLGKKFFLDFGAEMNGDWSPWSGADNGQSADRYIAAYRHIHDVLVAGGATNVVWLWCPNVTDEPREAWNETLNYYPGDTYVDWTCVDGYNWGSSGGGGWQTFQDVFRNVYPKLATKGKPIMIGEMASAEVGGNKAQWIDAIIPTLKADYPLIRGLVWFDIDKETDWRISSSLATEQAFVRMANDPYFDP